MGIVLDSDLEVSTVRLIVDMKDSSPEQPPPSETERIERRESNGESRILDGYSFDSVPPDPGVIRVGGYGPHLVGGLINPHPPSSIKDLKGGESGS